MKLFKRKEKFNPELTIKKLIRELNDNFNNVGGDIDATNETVSSIARDFYELREELVTNGVVSQLAKLRKDHDELRENTSVVVRNFYNKFDDLERNGVATAINKLNAEVFGEKTDGDTSAFWRDIYAMADAEPAQKVTLRGKLDAVIKHLGLDVSVKPREVIESKIITKKVKTAKKGKK